MVETLGTRYLSADGFRLACLDTAYTEDTMNDPSGMIIWGIFSGDTKAQANRMLDVNGRPIYMDRTYEEGAPHVMCVNAWDERLELHKLVQKVAKTLRHIQSRFAADREQGIRYLGRARNPPPVLK